MLRDGTYRKLVFENEIFLVSRIFFSETLISKMDVKMNLRIKTKITAADPEIEFPKKPILQPCELESPFRKRGS